MSRLRREGGPARRARPRVRRGDHERRGPSRREGDCLRSPRPQLEGFVLRVVPPSPSRRAPGQGTRSGSKEEWQVLT